MQLQIRQAKWRRLFVKNVFLKTWVFVQFCSVANMWSKYVSNNVRRDFRILVSAFARVARKSFNCKFTAEIGFKIRHFTLLLLTRTLCLKSLHNIIMISVWFTCSWNLNQIVWPKMYKIWNFCTKTQVFLKKQTSIVRNIQKFWVFWQKNG